MDSCFSKIIPLFALPEIAESRQETYSGKFLKDFAHFSVESLFHILIVFSSDLMNRHKGFFWMRICNIEMSVRNEEADSVIFIRAIASTTVEPPLRMKLLYWVGQWVSESERERVTTDQHTLRHCLAVAYLIQADWPQDCSVKKQNSMVALCEELFISTSPGLAVRFRVFAGPP